MALERAARELPLSSGRHAVFWCGPGAVADDHLSPLDFWSFLHGLYPDWQPLAVVRHAEAERSALWLVASHEAPLPADATPSQEWRLTP